MIEFLSYAGRMENTGGSRVVVWVKEMWWCEMVLPCLTRFLCLGVFAEAKAAPNICFAEVNSKGDRFGNCGFHGHDYKKCSSG